MSRQNYVPFDSKGFTANKVDDFSIRIFYRGENRNGFMQALRYLAMITFGEPELESDEPGKVIYRMRFSCTGDTYHAMSTMSDARQML